MNTKKSIYTGPEVRTVGHKKYDELLIKIIKSVGDDKSREELLQIFLNGIKKISSATSIAILTTAYIDYEKKGNYFLKGIEQRGIQPNRWTRFLKSKEYKITPESILYKVIEGGMVIDVWGTAYFHDGFEILSPIFDIKKGGWLSGVQLPRATASYDNQGVFFWYLTGKRSENIPHGCEQDWRILKLFQYCYSMAGYNIRKVARDIIMQRQELLRSLTPSILNHEINARIYFFKTGLEYTLKDIENTKEQIEKNNLKMEHTCTDTLEIIYNRLCKQLLPHAESLSKIAESIMGLTRRIASGITDPLKEINSAIELVSHKASDASVIIKLVQCKSKTRLDIESDPALLMHIIVNLLINSIEALEPIEIANLDQEKVIFIEIDWINEENNNLPLRIKIKDNGPGIESSYIDKIFEAGITTKKSGHGLGLAICKMIANYLGGTLEITSYKNPTEFSLSLPRESPKIADLEEELKNAVERP